MSHLYLIFSFKLCFSAAPGSKKSHPYRCSANGWDAEMNDPGRSSCCCMLLCQKIPIFHFYLTLVPSSTRSSSVIASRGLAEKGVRGGRWFQVGRKSSGNALAKMLLCDSMLPLFEITLMLYNDLTDHQRDSSNIRD